MIGCLGKLLPRLDEQLNNDELGLRATALKTFSALIHHCKVTKVVDDQVKETRKGLRRISLEYLEGIVTLFINDADEDVLVKYLQAPEAERTGDKPLLRPYQSVSIESCQLLKTMQDFASIAVQAKLSNLFLGAYASLVTMHEETLAMQQSGSCAPDIINVRFN